jgi:hypothetical protein
LIIEQYVDQLPTICMFFTIVKRLPHLEAWQSGELGLVSLQNRGQWSWDLAGAWRACRAGAQWSRDMAAFGVGTWWACSAGSLVEWRSHGLMRSWGLVGSRGRKPSRAEWWLQGLWSRGLAGWLFF